MGGAGSGRRPGVAESLPRGVRALIETAQQAERLGIVTDEAWGTVLGVMRGTVAGRHLRERLSAAVFVLEQKIGKAKQAIEHTGDVRLHIVESPDGAC